LLSHFDFWEFLAGLGIFLFGMFLMEEAIKNLAGQKLKRIIARYTSGRLKGVALGTISTAILQSSSVVSLMVLAFVGSGILSLQNAIGVIIGSNLGTTLTSWIVAIVGFKLNIEALAMPFVGLGGIGLIFFGKKTNLTNISKMIVGFGFLFLGLAYMKTSIDEFTQVIDISVLPANLFVYLIAGILITAIVQSSSASMAIILSSIHAGILGFLPAMSFVIGTNVGTTITVLLGSLGGGDSSKRKVAISHLFFNLVTAIVAFILIYPIYYLITDVLELHENAVVGIALFHTIFNLIGVIIFLPFLHKFADLINRMVKEKKVQNLYIIHTVPAEIPEAALSALRQEVERLYRISMIHNLKLWDTDISLVLSENVLFDKNILDKNTDELYESIKLIQGSIFQYATEIQKSELSGVEFTKLNQLLQSTRFCVAAAKSMKDIRNTLNEVKTSENRSIRQYFIELRKKFSEFCIKLDKLSSLTNEEILATLNALLLLLNKEDSEMITDFIAKLQQEKLSELDISSLLSLKRNKLLSNRQLILACRDLYLDDDEHLIFESLNTALSS
jgi:phosphate:Na+ symporter